MFDSSKPSTLNCVTEWKEIIDFTIKQKNGNPIPVFLLANKVTCFVLSIVEKYIITTILHLCRMAKNFNPCYHFITIVSTIKYAMAVGNVFKIAKLTSLIDSCLYGIMLSYGCFVM